MNTLSVWKGAVAVFMLVGVLGVGINLYSRHKDTVATQQCAGITMVVSDSTEAQCAALRSARSELVALKGAAKALNGTLVAGTKIIIKRDTIYKAADTVRTTVAPDGTRTAVRTDTTDDYQVRIEATAPPTGQLSIGYSIITPERTIEVGFVKRADGYYAVATGKGVRTTESFFTPEKPRAFSLQVGGSVKGSPAASVVGAKLGLDAYGAVQYAPGNTAYQIRVGNDGSPYVGLAVQKRLW